MNILLTGASGFVGVHIFRHVAPENTLATLGRIPVGDRHISCDLARSLPDFTGHSFDLVIHAAGKANAVPRNRSDRLDYNRINVQGTSRLLTALEQLPTLPVAVVHLSTVLVYGRSAGILLNERTPLTATDAYALSKIQSEQLVLEWGKRTGIRTAILRLPLVVAKKPTGNVAAMSTAIRRGYYVRIGTGSAQRSMVRADDVASVIVRAAEVGGIFNLTDGCHPTVYELENALARMAGRRWPIPVVSLALAKRVAQVGDAINHAAGRRFPLDSVSLQKLTSSLTFSDENARRQLDWNPRPVLDLFG